MSENHNGMDETHPTSPRTLATPTRFLVAARAPQRTSPTACPREADERCVIAFYRARARAAAPCRLPCCRCRRFRPACCLPLPTCLPPSTPPALRPRAERQRARARCVRAPTAAPPSRYPRPGRSEPRRQPAPEPARPPPPLPAPGQVKRDRFLTAYGADAQTSGP